MVLNWFTNFGRYLSMIRITDYLDMLIMAAVIYKVLSLGKNSRATSLFKGLGVFLLALGLLTLILGLMPPRTTDVIIVGGAVIIAGLLEFALARGRTPPRIPASCKAEENEEHLSYTRIKCAFESLHRNKRPIGRQRTWELKQHFISA